jgi:hypothetical protein
MSCRSTPGNSAVISHAMLVTNQDGHEVQVAFHDLRRAGAGLPAPAPEVADGLLARRARQVLADPSMTATQNESVLARLAASRESLRERGGVPDGATFYAWSELVGEARDGARRGPRGAAKRSACCYLIPSTSAARVRPRASARTNSLSPDGL